MGEIRIVVLDVEESGGGPGVGGIIEVGTVLVHRDSEAGEWIIDPPVSRLCNPKKPILPGARGVHHISPAELEGAPSPSSVLFDLFDKDVDAFCAHYAEYETGWVGGLSPMICSWRCAQRVWPGLESYKNQSLRYELGFDDLDPALAMPPHRAGPDAYVTAHILVELLKQASIEQLIQWTSEPLLFSGPIRFGKHKGVDWKDLPADYLCWMVNAPDMDADNKFTARHYIGTQSQRKATGDPFA